MQLPEEESGASRRRLCFIKAGCAERCFEENPFLPRLGSESGKKRETNQEKPQPFFDSKCCFCLELEAFREWEIQNCFSLSPSSLDPSYFSKCIAHTLYEKYSSSQNYYNAKEIGEYLSSARTSGAIKIRDFLDFDNSNEFLKRFYSSGEYQGKIRMLSEYYKFHRDIPRLFMLPPTTILNRFHDEKRRSEFKKITKLLSSDDEKEKNSEKYLRERNTDPNEFNQAARHRTLPQKPKSSKYYLDGNDTLNREAKGTSGVNEGRNPGRKRGTEESCSRTIKELNSKLGEIISRVCQVPKLEMEPTLENEEKDLASFITFLKKKEQGLREGEQNQESERKKLESEDDSEILPRKRERNEMEEEANGNFNGEDCPTKEETKGLESPSKEPMSNDEKASINSQKRENQKNKSSKTTTATESVYSLASKRNFFKIYSNESSSQKGSGILPVSLYNGNASGKEAQGPMHHMLSQQNFPNKFVGKETKPEVIKEDAADEQNENCQEDINIFRRKISLDEKFLFQPVHASKIQWGEERQNRGKVPTDQKGVEPNEKKEAQEPSGKRRGVLSSSPSKEQIKNSSSLVKTECCHNKKKPKGKETQTRNYCANEKNQSRDKKERETKKNSICFLPDKKENKNNILDHQNQKLAGTNFTSKGELASHQLNLHPETKLNQKGPQKSKENDLDAAMLSKLQETRKAKEPKCFNKHGIVQESMSISRSESTCQIQKQPRPKAKIMNEMESQASKKTQKKTTTQQEASKGTNKMTKSLACFSMMRPSFVNVQPSPKNKPSLVPQTHTYIGAETSKKCIEPTSGLMKNGTIPNYISNHLKSSSHAKFRESLKNQQRNKEATKKPTGTSKSPGSQSKEQKPKTKGENHQLQNHSLKPNNGASSPKLQTLKEKLKTKKPLKELSTISFSF